MYGHPSFPHRFAAILYVAALGVAFTSARADVLEPLQANVTTLGPATIVTYYAPGADGLAFVATAQAGEDGSAAPLRFAVTLAPTQRVVISVPQAAGAPPLQVTFARIGNRLEVMRSTTTETD